MRPLFVRAWVLLIYSVPTSLLILFAALYAVSGAAAGSTRASSAVVFGNLELVALVMLLAALVMLNVGSAVQYWLDAHKPEIHVRFLAGQSRFAVTAHLLSIVTGINCVGLSIASVGYLVCRGGGAQLPPFSAPGFVLALIAGSVLMACATSVGVVRISRKLDHVRAY